MSEITIDKQDFDKLLSRVDRIEDDMQVDRQRNGERLYKIEVDMSVMRENIMTKLEEVKAAVSSKEGITFLVQSKLDDRYAGKIVETWFYRFLWFIFITVAGGVVYLVIKQPFTP